MLKFKRSPTSQSADFSQPARNRRKCSFVSSQTGYSLANVFLKHVSVPLAWPADEYFGNKKEWREFTVQLILKTSEGKEIFSKPKKGVNRTYTDVDFEDVFAFGDQSPEFCVEVMIYCKRTDENANPNIVQTLSRSLGRSLGHSLKRYIRSANNTVSGGNPFSEENRRDLKSGSISHGLNALPLNAQAKDGLGLDSVYIENYRNTDKMCALGVARFCLRNATLSGRTHTYNLELVPQGTYPGITRSQLLPLYGNICAQLLVQPTSFCSPLAQGQLDMFFVEGGILLQKMECVLRGSFLKCYSESDVNGPPSLTLPINQTGELTTTFPAEEEEPAKQVEPNTYVISLQIGIEDRKKLPATGSTSSYAQFSSSSNKCLSNTSNRSSVTFTEDSNKTKNKQLAQKSSNPLVLPRARLNSTAASEVSRRQQHQSGSATVSRAEKWHYANSSTQFTRL